MAFFEINGTNLFSLWEDGWQLLLSVVKVGFLITVMYLFGRQADRSDSGARQEALD